MKVDNHFYDRVASQWWDETGPLYALHPSANPARIEYVLKTLMGELGTGFHRVLDLGCGGGFVSEALVHSGLEVCGIDPSEPSLMAARVHALQSGLEIDYRLGYGEHLPLTDSSFDAVCCLDALEHVTDLGAVLSEVARVLRPGGVFIYDTINRTFKSRFVIAFLLQDFPPTRLAPKRLHDPKMFITPKELQSGMAWNGLEPCETIGMAPQVGLLTLARDMRLCKLGRIAPAEAFRRSKVGPSTDTSISYVGFARKVGA
jgi:2-polyprenyl-6-hydroxyphenyl methylase / 3-demethylubiquinone-9 3-methyltransferase